MSLVEHAIKEMSMVGLYDVDNDYGGMLGKAVEELVRVFAAQGHSGFFAYQTMKIFNVVANFKRLSPLTDSSDEWMSVSEMFGCGMWQNRRDGSCFSTDAGNTYYDIGEQQSWWRRLLPQKAPLRWRLKHHKSKESK